MMFVRLNSHRRFASLVLLVLLTRMSLPATSGEEPMDSVKSKWSSLVDISREEFESLPFVEASYLAEKVAESRDLIVAGAFEYTIMIKRRGQLKNEMEQYGLYAFNEETETYFHARRDLIDLPAGSEQTSTGKVEIPEIKKVANMAIFRQDDFVEMTNFEAGSLATRSTGYIRQRHDAMLNPFYFRSFGLAFYGDFSLKKADHDVIAGYANWPPFRVLSGRRDKSTYVSMGTKIEFDKENNFWPIRHLSIVSSRSKNGIEQLKTLSKCEISLTQFEGTSLPSTVTYEATNRPTISINLKWHSINGSPKLDLLQRELFIVNSVSFLDQLETQ